MWILQGSLTTILWKRQGWWIDMEDWSVGRDLRDLIEDSMWDSIER